MAKKIINIGKSQNKGDGDPLRTAFSKVNDNFDELYSGTFTDTTNFGTDIIPGTDNNISLGSTTKRWSELYVADFIFINGVRLSGSSTGDLVVRGNVVQAKDIVGSVFADDSKVMMDGTTGTLFGPMIGDVTGSVFADNSTILVDGVSGKITLGNNTADDLPEGSTNKYFNGKTTDDLPEGPGNLYYTETRWDTRLAAKNTDQLSEGATNKYFTDPRVQTVIDLNTAGFATTAYVNSEIATVSAGHFNFSITGDDSTQRVVNKGDTIQIVGGTGIDTSSDINGNITVSASYNSPVLTGIPDFTGCTIVDLKNTAVDFTGSTITGTNFLTSVPAQSFASLTGKPTTLAGYGITDALTAGGALQSTNLQPTDETSATTKGSTLELSGGDSTGLNSNGGDLAIVGGNGSSGTHGDINIGTSQTNAITIGNTGTTSINGIVDFTGATSIDFNTVTINNLEFADISAKPTTLAGYGITDAFDGAFGSLSGKPTTLGGYGITDAATTGTETTFTKDVHFDRGVEEKFQTLTGQSGVVAHNWNDGHVFYHTTPAGDITANFINVNLTAEYSTNVTIIINQGATPYEVTAVQIGGAAQTINWQGGSAPTGTANGIDSFSFTILNDGGSYVVLGQMVDFT